MRGWLTSTCAGRLGTGWGFGGNSQEKEHDSISPAVHYKPWEGSAVLVQRRAGGWGGHTLQSGRGLCGCALVSHSLRVCSDARNMARDVQNTFYEIVSEFGNMSQPQAVDYVKKLMTKGRYSLDVWS